jgi:ribosome biogenesis GTPase / thiamine phosphate phosphatase
MRKSGRSNIRNASRICLLGCLVRSRVWVKPQRGGMRPAPLKAFDLIEQYGWTDRLARDFELHAQAGLVPARVVVQHRDSYLVVGDQGELRARASGRLLNEADELSRPTVGDWVGLSLDREARASIIHATLQRRTAFVRRAADSERRSQVIAANIDVAFIVTSLNGDLNPRRIERYLAAASQSGARPVVVLTKSDLSADPQSQAAEVAEISAGRPVLVVSAREGAGLEAMLSHVRRGETCVLIGSSGVGKSTLVNAFLGEERMATHAIREGDGQGRHTTSHRELVLLPGGGLLLDTPGIREVGLINADEGVGAVFEDIEQLARDCRFNDCTHAHEPGCAVRAALQAGVLDPARWAHFQKLSLESSAVQKKAGRLSADAERRRIAGLQKVYRAAKRDSRNAD